jgi:predicted phage terminase large subunit-like protein
LYVVESFCEKLHPDKFLDYIVDRTLYYEPDRIAADSNAAQEFLTYTLRERLRAVGYPSYTRIKEIKDRTKKELRIEAMLPDIVNGHIQFNKQHYRLLEQFETYPQGTHDDAIDSLCYAVQIGKINTQGSVEKPWWM